MIPKIIHYCWYGHGKYSNAISRCLESWKLYCPDYEFMLWNEDNSPMEIKWIQDAYKSCHYAFVADYMRFWALYHYGGVYLDTDMLLIKPIDELLTNEMFLGREDERLASMGIIGMPQYAEFCKKCLEYYDTLLFETNNVPIITEILTPTLVQFGFKFENKTQTLSNGLTVYQSSYFYPVHYRDQFDVEELFEPPYGGFVKDDQPTYAIHLWNKSWADEWELFSKKKYREGFAKVWWRVRENPKQPVKYYKKVAKSFVKMILGW